MTKHNENSDKNCVHQILNQFWSTSKTKKIFQKYLKKFFKCKYFSFEKFKWKYFSKVFKMHLNANAFDPISAVCASRPSGRIIWCLNLSWWVFVVTHSLILKLIYLWHQYEELFASVCGNSFWWIEFQDLNCSLFEMNVDYYWLVTCS